MDDFIRCLHRVASLCPGGLRCAWCAPRPSSSAGHRRLARLKARSHRAARARSSAELRRFSLSFPIDS